MSSGRGWNDRMREQNDLEDGRNARNPRPGVGEFTPLSVIHSSNINTSVSSSSTSTGPTTAAGARDSHNNRGNSIYGRPASQDPRVTDSLSPDLAAPQHITGVSPAARPAGNKRRMSLGR